MTADPDPILVLGGGPAGLAAAWALEDLRCPYLVLEGAPVPGGNARTLRWGDFLYDTGPHRFHDRDPDATRRVQALLGADSPVVLPLDGAPPPAWRESEVSREVTWPGGRLPVRIQIDGISRRAPVRFAYLDRLHVERLAP